MSTVRFKLTNISPLIMHNAAGMRPHGKGIIVKHIPEPEEEAEAGTYRMPDGQLYLGANAAHSSLIDGGRGRKVGKEGLSKLLGSTVFMTHVECPLFDPDTGLPIHDYVIDSRRVIVVNQGVIRARPRIDRWTCEVTFEYDSERIAPQIILEAFGIAGTAVGLLEYRPRPKLGKPGPFGRFKVELIEVIE